MKRRLVVASLACLALAGCGGSSHHAGGHPPGWGKPQPGLLPKVGATATPTVSMFDTITLGSLSGLRPQVLAGYTAGHWPTYLPLVHAYPSAKVKSISIGVGFHAMCGDFEPGDMPASSAASWYFADRRAGFSRPCEYSSLWEYVNQIRPVLARAGIARSSIWEWDADYTNVPHIDAGFDATQWTDHAYGRNLDQSLVTLAFAGLTPAPKPKPKPDPRIHWRVALKASERAYARNGCPVLAQRVGWFTTELKAHPRIRVAHRRQALAASRSAYQQRGCAVSAQRVAYFSKRLG